LSLSARMRRGGGGSRSPAATGEAAGTGVAAGDADDPGTTQYPLPDQVWSPKLGSGFRLGQVDWERR
jgi:hypothetical protein